MTRPDYCPDDLPDDRDPANDDIPCPACGATTGGRDKVRGVCRARFAGPKPRPLLELVLIDKTTGKIVARTN